MTILAGVFLALFGGLTSWLLAARYPTARYMRIGYALMTLGGLMFVVWSVTMLLALGFVALVVLLLGGLFGVIGALRRELRVTPPV